MSEQINQEILHELKKINEKLDRLEAETEKGLSTPMKIVALLFGLFIIGPIFSFLIISLFSL